MGEGGRGVSVATPPDRARRLAAVEAELAETRRHLASLIEAIGSIVWSADTERGFVEPQPSWERYTGQTPDELLRLRLPERRPSRRPQGARRDRPGGDLGRDRVGGAGAAQGVGGFFGEPRLLGLLGSSAGRTSAELAAVIEDAVTEVELSPDPGGRGRR